MADGNAAPERRSFVFATDELLGKADANALKLIDSAIDWTGGTGFLTSPSSAELLEGETVTLSAEGYAQVMLHTSGRRTVAILMEQPALA